MWATNSHASPPPLLVTVVPASPASDFAATVYESFCQSADNKEVYCKDSKEMQARCRNVDSTCSSTSLLSAWTVQNDQ